MSSGAGVTSGVLVGLAPSSGKRWTINKGLASARPLPEGLGPQLQSWTRWTGQTHRQGAGLGAWPAPQRSRVTAVVAGRGGAAVLGSGPPPSPPRRSARRAPAGASRGQRSDFHERDLEALHHALHVEDEGVLIRVVLDDVVVHVHQDAAGEGVQRHREQCARQDPGWGSLCRSLARETRRGEDTRWGEKTLTLFSLSIKQFEESKASIPQS